MRRRVVVGLALLNGIAAFFLFATPADTQIVPMGIWNCCESTTELEAYCCDHCCWFTPGCRGC